MSASQTLARGPVSSTWSTVIRRSPSKSTNPFTSMARRSGRSRFYQVETVTRKWHRLCRDLVETVSHLFCAKLGIGSLIILFARLDCLSAKFLCLIDIWLLLLKDNFTYYLFTQMPMEVRWSFPSLANISGASQQNNIAGFTVNNWMKWLRTACPALFNVLFWCWDWSHRQCHRIYFKWNPASVLVQYFFSTFSF